MLCLDAAAGSAWDPFSAWGHPLCAGATSIVFVEWFGGDEDTNGCLELAGRLV